MMRWLLGWLLRSRRVTEPEPWVPERHLPLKGFRQPKGGVWHLEWVNFHSPLPEAPRLSLPSKALGIALLLAVLGHLLPWEWAFSVLPIFGLNELVDTGTFVNDPAANVTKNRECWTRVNSFYANQSSINSRTINAGSNLFFAGATTEARITLAIAQAVAELATAVYVPAFMLPYDASLVTFNNAVQMVREGGPQATGLYDAEAYGVAADGVLGVGNVVTGTDDTAAWNAVVAVANSFTKGAVILAPPGASLFSTGLVFTTPTTIVGNPTQSKLVFTGTGVALTWNYASPLVGLGGFLWGPGLQHIQLWRQGLDFTQTGIVLGGAAGAHGLAATKCRFIGFALNLSLTTNCFGVHFDHCNFDAALQQVNTDVNAVFAGENMSFLHCVFANGQNLTNGILWQREGFNGEFVSCSFDGVQVTVSGGTAHFTNSHWENLGMDKSHLVCSGGIVDLVACEFYVNGATFTPDAPVMISNGSQVTAVGCLGFSALPNIPSLFNVAGASSLFEFGTKQLTNFLKLYVSTATAAVRTGGNIMSAGHATVPYGWVILGAGGSVTPDLAISEQWEILATGSPITINLPTGVLEGKNLYFEIHNSSGGPLVTNFNANYFLVGGAFTSPANGNGRTIWFRGIAAARGAQMLEYGRGAGDL